MKKKLLISFSGGRTSAYMVWWLLNEWQDRHNWEIIVVFANTGKEAEGTLFFVDECAQEWGINIVWVEAKCKDENGIPFSEKGWSVHHKVVIYETASRNGEPFEEMISVLGIPSTNAPFCSVQLKRKAIESYARSIGWEGHYTAIGLRVDEAVERMNKNYHALKIIYPFIHLKPTVKRQISEWWGKQSFDLDIDPDEGNCDGCWKKDELRLVRLAVKKPQIFNWWELMVEKYGHLNPREVDQQPPFQFYRGQKSVLDIRKLADMSQAELKQLTLFEPLDGCAESCEVYGSDFKNVA